MSVLKYKGFLRRRCPNCKHIFMTKSSKVRFCSKRCENEVKAMEKRHEQTVRSPTKERKKAWFVLLHEEKIRRHVMEQAKKRKQENG